MRLLVLESAAWTVTSAQTEATNGKYECTFTESLNSLGANYEKSLDGLMAMLEKFSQHGPKFLNDEICHEVDSNNKIFEFIKGDLRLLWFYGAGNKIIVCSHIFVKKGQKTPAPQKNIAIRIRDRYLKLVKTGKPVKLYFDQEAE